MRDCSGKMDATHAKIYGLVLTRRFVRDTTMLRNLLATCGTDSVTDSAMSAFFNADHLHLLLFIHRNLNNIRTLSDRTLVDVLLIADFLQNVPCYVAAAEEMARRYLKSRDISPWLKVADEYRECFLEVVSYLPDLISFHMMKEGLLEKEEYKALPRLRRAQVLEQAALARPWSPLVPPLSGARMTAMRLVATAAAPCE